MEALKFFAWFFFQTLTWPGLNFPVLAGGKQVAGEFAGGNLGTLVCLEHQGLSSHCVLGTGIKQLLRRCLQPPAKERWPGGQAMHTGSPAWSCSLELSGTTELGLGQGWPLPTPPSRSGCMHIRFHSSNQVSTWKMNPDLLGQ